MNHLPKEFKLRRLKAKFGASRTNDDVHRSIQLCPLTMAILDTPHMQRLRGLKQLGVSEMTYIPTTHCRFEHSLGVSALAEQLLRSIHKKQPKLNITEKDIICVKIAGLLHDIGHGPFSHVYDGKFRKQLKTATAQGHWLGHPIPKSSYEGMPEVMDGWEHEDGSLMMIDALLEFLGLQIDDKNLDKPLRQIGDGIRADSFGICGLIEGNYELGDSSKLTDDRVLTSRDWIFIKECIIGGPLPPDGISVDAADKLKLQQELVGRPDKYMEFLYDVVANKRHGFDVDKMDYLARDDRRAFGSSGQIDPIFIENAHVAWGDCSRPENIRHNVKLSRNKRDYLHMMIVYPEKMVQNAMNFFKLRFRNHQKLYTHHNTNAACYMICDILLLADPFIRLSTADEGDGTLEQSTANGQEMKMSISRANVLPSSYLLLKDSILDIISATTDNDLLPARKLINRYHSHKIYKMIAQVPIVLHLSWQRELWNMEEEDIVSEICKCSQLSGGHPQFTKDDMIIEKRQIHHGMKESNPVDSMRFLPKSQLSKLQNSPENLPIAQKISEIEYECCIPRAFLQRTFRIYCRSYEKSTREHLETCYHQFIANIQKRYGDFLVDVNVENPEYMPPNILSQSPTRCSNESFAFSQSSLTTNFEPVQKRRRKRKSLLSSVNEHLDSP